MSSKSCTTRNHFKDIREAQHLSRKRASELTECISPTKLEHIERGNTEPRPEEVLCLARCYQSPELINLYCCETCAIGKLIAPRATLSNPQEIIINLLSASNKLSKIKTELIQTTTSSSSTRESAEVYLTLNSILDEIGSCNASLSIWLHKNKIK